MGSLIKGGMPVSVVVAAAAITEVELEVAESWGTSMNWDLEAEEVAGRTPLVFTQEPQ
jgi:hypothetical protein